MSERGNTVCAGIQHAAFSHILIANHTTLICASNINLNQLYFYMDRLVYCAAGCSGETQKGKNISRSLEILPSAVNQKEPKELKFVFSYFFSFAVLFSQK